MSWVMVSPELVVAAAADLAGIGSAISSANAAAAVNTTGLLTAGADEVSTAIAALFGAQGQAYQAASAQAAAFYAQFVQALSAGGGAYAAAEAAAVSPLLAPINAQFVAATGRPLIGNGANGAPGTGANGGPGGWLIGNGGALLIVSAAAGWLGGSAMSDAQDSRVGSMFGPYHLKRLLGRGGMGEVYEAEHTVKEWTVAVKLMTAEFSKDPVFRERMKREARIAGRLQEPHVVPIHDYGEVDGQMFLEMRLVEGTDLDSVLKRFGPLTPPRAVAIITQIASALDAAHADGVMHRDVKPQNILITRDDFAYLVDFGIASATTDEKLTQLGTAVGTWKYMAPERFSNDEVTYRADIYALACVLHECLTGARRIAPTAPAHWSAPT